MVQTEMDVDLEQELMETLSKEIAKEIDEGIMLYTLLEAGWTPVKFYFKSKEHSNDVHIWLLENCKNAWHRYGSEYVFKDKKEAEWFILRWL